MEGWGNPVNGRRWTIQRKVGLAFSLDRPEEAELLITVRPHLADGRIERQRVQVRLNGAPIIEHVLDQDEHVTLIIPLPLEHLRAENVLELNLPDARSPLALGVGCEEEERGLLVSWVRFQRAALP
jgi:hypothetical protein